MTTNRFLVPLFSYCFLSLALNIYIQFFLRFPTPILPISLLPFFIVLFKIAVRYVLLLYFLCVFFVYLSIRYFSFLPCPITISYIIEKTNVCVSLYICVRVSIFNTYMYIYYTYIYIYIICIYIFIYIYIYIFI